MQAVFSYTTARRGPPLAFLAIVAAGVFFSAAAVNELACYTGHVSGIWIANAVLLFFVLKSPRRHWIQIFAVGIGANIAADCLLPDRTFSVFCMALCNALEVLIIAVPLRLLKLDRGFSRPTPLLTFYALALGPASIVSAAVSSAIFHLAYGAPFLSAATNWYAADALGLTIVVPPLMTVRWTALKAMFSREQLLGSVLGIGAVAAAIAVNYFNREYPIAFLFFPAVVLLTFQRGFAGGAIGLILTGSYLLVPVLLGDIHSTLRGHSQHDQIVLIQIYVAVIGFSVVLVGAALEERKRLERGLALAIGRAEAAREEAYVARDSAEKANRAKSMFLANMSHELRTPLNAVIGFAEIMHAEPFGALGDPRYREYSGLIQEAGRHLLDLINDILDMSKIEAGKHELSRERLSVNAVVRECMEMMRERAMQGAVALSTDLPSAPMWIFADKRAMKQILLNLLSNAIKFTQPGGSVTLRARLADGLLGLSVADTGIGIPADQLYRLGNPFVQLKSNVGTTQAGTGLGLALVRALVRMHGGSFKIDSVEGRGTTVCLSIPASEKASLAA